MAYVNQKAVDELNEKLKKIDKDLRLGRFGVNENNEVTNAGVRIAVKGNKKKIDALKNMGFEITQRFKEPEPFTAGYASGRYKGYKMFVIMEKAL